MCIGASLARKELDVAFAVLIQRLDGLALACAEEDLRYPPNALLRGVERLPVTFTGRPRSQA
jgi:cytochrome P450